MSLILYGHPFSSYTQKALIAAWEKGVDLDYRIIGGDDAGVVRDWLKAWPLARFPVLVADSDVVGEATAVIEMLDVLHPEPRMIPADPRQAVQVRMMDRLFDNFVMHNMQTIVLDALRPEDARDAYGVAKAREALERTYAYLDKVLRPDAWAVGDGFTLADCAAAPSLFYADWAHPIPDAHATLRGYRARLLAHPSVARAVDEARPFRPNFPLGAPDRD